MSMRGISTPELSLLARELDAYAGYHIDRFYELGEGRFRMKLTRSGSAVNLLCILCHTINKTSYIERVDVPSNFCMAARKRVEGALVKRVYQLNSDRILVFVIEKGGYELNMIFEMFGRGNLVITDSSMLITLAYTQHTFKDRAVQVGAEYKPPKSNATANLKEAAQGTSGRASVYLRDGKVVDYSLAETGKYDGPEKKEFDSLQEALDFVYAQEEAPAAKENPEVKRLEASIEKQRELVKSAAVEAEQCKRAGQLLFNSMHDLNQLISAAMANRRVTVKELQGLFPGFKIRDINLKDKTLTIELD